MGCDLYNIEKLVGIFRKINQPPNPKGSGVFICCDGNAIAVQASNDVVSKNLRLFVSSTLHRRLN